MPPPSKIAALPAEVGQELRLRVIESGFSDYKGHAEWLQSQGYDISYMAVWRYFKPVEKAVRREILAISVSTASVSLYAALQRQVGEDYALASQGMLQRYRHEKLRQAIEDGDISLEELEAYERLERGQGLTSLRGERERALRERAPAAAPPLPDSRDRAAAEEIARGDDPVETIKRIRRDVYGIVDD